ncbi:hypothetical protein [Halomonas sp. ND22Bw]|uniref:hypothetical protein n=1 Tax=Halomonas sp. ND22Bw TaxID=2054178 RepID=UPI0011B1F9D0
MRGAPDHGLQGLVIRFLERQAALVPPPPDLCHRHDVDDPSVPLLAEDADWLSRPTIPVIVLP